MHLTVETSDDQPSSIVEAGLDKFEVIDNGVGVHELSGNSMFNVMPNPFENELTINCKSSTGKLSSVEIYNSLGDKVFSATDFSQNSLRINSSSWSTGIYVVRLIGDGSMSQEIKVCKPK